MSWAEAKWTVDTLLQKMGQAPNNMRAFAAFSLSKNSIGLRFQEPADSYDGAGNLICSVKGVMIRKSTTDYPATITDGDLVVDNTNLDEYVSTPFEVTGLTEGTTYYFSAFPYSTQGVYNLSSNEANRAETSPEDGEKVNVTVNVDNPAEFTSTTVTCVDETDGTQTKSVTITPSHLTASFTVGIGHTYHIEYGAVEGYSQPGNTTSKVSVAGATTAYTATYYFFTSTIAVTYPAGATVTCSCEGTTYTAPTTTGSYTFSVHNVGTWVITATQGSETASDSVSITSSGQSRSVELSFVKIYGISRDTSVTSPTWARTDDSVGKTATASVGTTPGASSFDNCYPWSGIVRENIGNDVMVKIPKFWFRRYKSGNVEYLKIADKATTGFTLHPAFKHGNVERDYFHIGAYKTSSNNKSVSGASPQVSQTRAAMRTNAKNKGTGWGLIDLTAYSAIEMLMLVEFATCNMQTAIGRGYCDGNSNSIASGSTNNVPNLTGRPAGTDGKVDVVWRGIEGFWGNIWEWVDGLNFNNGEYWFCNDPTKYADDTSTNYTKLSYNGTTNWSGSYITALGLDTNNPFAMLPSAAGSGSETTYMCDACWSNTGWRVFIHGGRWADGSFCGLFAAALNYSSSYSLTYFGSRLLKIPS